MYEESEILVLIVQKAVGSEIDVRKMQVYHLRTQGYQVLWLSQDTMLEKCLMSPRRVTHIISTLS